MIGKSDHEVEAERQKRQVAEAKEQLLREQRELYQIPSHLDVDKLKEDRRIID